MKKQYFSWKNGKRRESPQEWTKLTAKEYRFSQIGLLSLDAEFTNDSGDFC